MIFSAGGTDGPDDEPVPPSPSTDCPKDTDPEPLSTGRTECSPDPCASSLENKPAAVMADLDRGWERGVAASQDLLERCGISVTDLLTRTVSSSLERYRQDMGVGFSQRRQDLSYPPELFAGLAPVACEEAMQSITHTLLHPLTAYGSCTTTQESLADLHDELPHDFCDDDDDGAVDVFGPTSPTQASASSLSPSHNEKIQWDEVFSEAGSVAGGDSDDDNVSVASRRSSVGGWGEASYGYALERQQTSESLSLADVTPIGRAFAPQHRNAATATFLAGLQMGGKGGGNHWAGARHWKSGLRKRTPSATSANTGDADDGAKKTKKRQTKEKFRFDFSSVGVGVCDQIENCPRPTADGKTGRGRADTTIMTAAAIQKNATLAKGGAYSLPQDANVTVKDLCRLFQWTALIVPPYNVTEGAWACTQVLCVQQVMCVG